MMIKYIKNNFPIFLLLFIVIGGLGYPFISGKWIAVPRLSEIDAKCYGVDIPKAVKYNQSELFCSCIHVSNIENTEEKYKYCINKMND